MSNPSVLALLTQAVTDAQGSFARAGIALSLVSPDGGSTALRLDAESASGMAQMVLYNSGDLTLVLVDSASGEVQLDEYRSVTSDLGVRDVLGTILEHLKDR